MSKTSNQPPPEKVELYDKLIDTHPEIERKGVTSPYTSVNGPTYRSPAHWGSGFPKRN